MKFNDKIKEIMNEAKDVHSKMEKKAESLKKAFPNIKGIRYDKEEEAIRLGDAAEGGEIDGDVAASYHDDQYVNSKLKKKLKDLKLHMEWYDAGTIFAYDDE